MEPIAFEIRAIEPFKVASQTFTLPAVHDGIDIKTGRRMSGTSVWSKDRTLRTYATDRKDDREAFIKADPMDITVSTRFPQFRVMRDEWNDEEMRQFKLFYTTHPNVCDFNNPEEYDKVKGAPIGKKANAKFLFEEKSATTKTRIEEFEETNLITTLLMSNKSNDSVLRAYMYFLGENPAQSATPQEMYVYLMETCLPVDGKHRETFLKTYIRQGMNEYDIDRTIIANRAIAVGEIQQVNGVYTYGTEKIGQSIDSVTLWLKGNMSALEALKRELGIDYTADLRKRADEERKAAEQKVSVDNGIEEVNKFVATKDTPYLKEHLEVLRPLFAACGVNKPELIGNHANATENECSLANLIGALNDKLKMKHGFELELSDIGTLVGLSKSIKIDFAAAKEVVRKRGGMPKNDD